MKVYVATSWRNSVQDIIVGMLRASGHEVYDFKNPAPDNNGFGWKQVGASALPWNAAEFREVLRHPIAKQGFAFDMDALQWCDVCVLVLPCGRSAHLELGWACGAGKRTYALIMDELGPHEPELMYSMLTGICVSQHELLQRLRHG